MKKILFFSFLALFFNYCPIFAASYESGESIVSKFISEKKGKLFIYGIATETPSLMFAFTEDASWENLTEDDKKSVCLYIQKSAQNAAFSPQKYIDIPKRMSGIHLAIQVFSKGYRPKQGKVAP